jgi:hypothetical protein
MQNLTMKLWLWNICVAIYFNAVVHGSESIGCIFLETRLGTLKVQYHCKHISEIELNKNRFSLNEHQFYMLYA